jgi:hypothetical protein
LQQGEKSFLDRKSNTIFKLIDRLLLFRSVFDPELFILDQDTIDNKISKSGTGLACKKREIMAT